MIRLIVANGHALVRHSLAHLLNLEPDLSVLGGAHDSRSALDLVSRHRPDVVVVDLGPPEDEALRTLSALRQGGAATAIVVVGTVQDDHVLRTTLRLRVEAHVMKDDSSAELVAAIRAAACGSTYRSRICDRRIRELQGDSTAAELGPVPTVDVAEIAEAPFMDLVHRFDDLACLLASPRARMDLRNGLQRLRAERQRGRRVFEELTPRERAVLLGLIDGQPAQAIAAESFVTLATVRSQIRSVLTKLGVNSQLEAVALARRVGWPALADEETTTTAASPTSSTLMMDLHQSWR